MTTSLVEEGRLNLLSFSRDLADVPGGRCVEDETYLLADTGSNTGLNRIIIKRSLDGPARGALDRLVGHFQLRESPFIIICPCAFLSEELNSYCAERQMRSGAMFRWPMMVRAATTRSFHAVPEGSRIARVAVDRTVGDWAGLLAESFGSGPDQCAALLAYLPDYLDRHIESLHVEILYRDEIPVCTGAAFRSLAGDVPGIYWVATARAWRGGGFAKALLAGLIDMHQDRPIHLQSTAPGVPLYTSLGCEIIDYYNIMVPMIHSRTCV